MDNFGLLEKLPMSHTCRMITPVGSKPPVQSNTAPAIDRHSPEGGSPTTGRNTPAVRRSAFSAGRITPGVRSAISTGRMTPGLRGSASSTGRMTPGTRGSDSSSRNKSALQASASASGRTTPAERVKTPSVGIMNFFIRSTASIEGLLKSEKKSRAFSARKTRHLQIPTNTAVDPMEAQSLQHGEK